MATLRKRGSRWQVMVRRAGHPAQARTFALRADAESWARDIERRIERGDLHSDARSLRRVTLADLLDRYGDTVTPAKKGRVSEAYRLARLRTRPIAQLSLDRCSPAAMAEFRDERLQQVSAESVRRELAILQHCFEVARREWGVALALNPVAAIRKPPAARGRQRRLEGDDWTKLAEGIKKTRNPLVMDVIRIAILTGMRRSEILSAQWRDLDQAKSLLRIRDSKNGEARLLALSEAALAIIARQSRGAPEDCLFPISGNAVRLAWERLKKRAGITDLRFHDLRHEAISRFFEAGLSIPEVSMLSGHKDTRMLLRYTHLREAELVNKIKELSGPTGE